MKNNPTGAMGVADHLGWNWKSAAGLPVVNIPGCPAQPDNMTEVAALPGAAPGRPGAGARPRRGAAPALAVRAHGPRGLQPGRLRRAGRSSRPSTATTRAAWSSSAARARWSSATSRSAAGSTATAAAPTWAASAWPARCPASPTSTCRSWTPDRAGGDGARTSSGSPSGRCSGTSATATSRTSTTSSPSGASPGSTLTTGYQPRNYS